MLKRAFALILFSCTLVPLLAGCHHDDVEVIEPDKPALTFEGAPDLKFAGAWKTTSNSKYNLDKSGSYTLDETIHVRGNKPIDSHLTGQWAVKGDRILFKDQAGNVAQYAYAFDGTKLTLTSTGSLKSKTIMIRQP
jgi:hypothetical protein